MRIVAGYLGGRTFEAPRGHRTHPMSDKIRGALFNALGDIGGLTVLDAYAGSGAISFEAISRGAKSAVAIDIDKGATTTLVNSLKRLGIENRVKAIQANAISWSENNPDFQFGLVILDPPYDAVNPPALRRLAHHVLPDGVLVLSVPPTEQIDLDEAFELLATKKYGDAKLVFYRRSK
jgi:16S rRNA (guanine966-N2)-methyltransferase